MRDEVKARLESKYIQQENQTRSQSFLKLKDMVTVEMEKHRLKCQNEATQKTKVISQEYDSLFDKIRAGNKQQLASMGEREKVLQEVRAAKEKVAELRRALAEAKDTYEAEEV